MQGGPRRTSSFSAAEGPLARAFTTLLLLLVVLSCTSGATFEIHAMPPNEAAPEAEFAGSELASAQRGSLGYVFYRGNDMPRRPSDRELRRLDRDFAEAPPAEVEELRALFGEDRELLVYATRDSDGDGILDYRISEYHGKFFEGDLDVDGDGVRNVYDSRPYDPKHGGRDTDGDGTPDDPGSFADRDGDGIPDHLDWSRRKADPLPDIQTRLFHDFHVILVERSDRFSPELVRACDDVLRLIYRKPLPTLWTIAVEDQLLLRDDLGDNGFMLAQTQTLTIYAKTIVDAPPIVLLGLVAHEVDHAWQLALDFDEHELAKENVRVHYPPGEFAEEIERFGWTADRKSLGGGYVHRLYWPHFYATSPKYQFRGESSKAWKAWIEAIEDEVGPGFLGDPRLATRGVIGPYSMTSPWEWHADQLMASLYNRMDRSVASHPNPAVAKSATLLRLRMLEAVQDQWSRYDYRNAIGSGIDRDFGKRFPLTDEELRHLVDRYVVPLVDLPVLARALALDGETPSLEPEGMFELLRELEAKVGAPLGDAARGAAEAGARIRDDVTRSGSQPGDADESPATDETTGELPANEADAIVPGPEVVPAPEVVPTPEVVPAPEVVPVPADEPSEATPSDEADAEFESSSLHRAAESVQRLLDTLRADVRHHAAEHVAEPEALEPISDPP
ncbi:hypothetical protein ACNOYE_21650 [Nannocystaceae bacterium ST9]